MATPAKSKAVLAIESGDVDALRAALAAAASAEPEADGTSTNGGLDAEDPETWLSPLHHCARLGEVACAKLLLELGANPNAEDIKGRTCLHEACDAYAADDAGDLKREDVLVALVDGGAVSLECLRGKLPDPGGDAGALVSSAVQRAFAAGKQARKDQKEVRKAKRKAKMDAIFSNAIHKVVANASACAITVMDTGDGDGYKYGSRDGAR
jgi:hypothetical protein